MVFVHHVQLPGLRTATVGLDVGVMVFFVLSGYLLYAPFVAARRDARALDVRGYLIRRLLRIYPAYLAAAAGIALLTGWLPPPDPLAIMTMEATPIVVAWTLRIELAFYLALPILAMVLSRAQPGVRHRILLAGAVASLAHGAAVVAGGIMPIDWLSFLFAFIPGIAVAELAEARPDLTKRAGGRRWLGVAVGLLSASIALDLTYPDVLGSVGAGLLVAHVISRPDWHGTPARIATAAGSLSYSVYLWHLTVIDAVARPTSTWLGALTAVVLTLGAAAVSFQVVERPAIRLGRAIAAGLGSRGAARALPETLPAKPASFLERATAAASTLRADHVQWPTRRHDRSSSLHNHRDGVHGPTAPRRTRRCLHVVRGWSPVLGAEPREQRDRGQ